MVSMSIYLDHAATTPLDGEVFQEMKPYFADIYGNASSLYLPARKALQGLNRAREKVRSCIQASSTDKVVFTGSGTESDNLAIFGVARRHKDTHRHIIVSSIEHKAVLEPAKRLEQEGFEVTRLKVSRDGLVDLRELELAIREDTSIVSVIYANNEIGTIQPIDEIAKIIKKKRGSGALPLFHTDACQAAGYLPLHVSELGVDLMTINGSKIYGPKGVGVLYAKGEVELEPLVVGGDQEGSMRAGTETVALAVGLASALEISINTKEKESARLTELRNYFIKRIQEEITGVHINGHLTKRLPNNINVLIEGVEGEAMVLMLDEQGIYVATGSACSSFDLQPSHVLKEIGVSPELAHGSLRLTLGKKTSKEELDKTLEALIHIVDRLRQFSSVK